MSDQASPSPPPEDRPLFPPSTGPGAPLFPGAPVRRPRPPLPAPAVGSALPRRRVSFPGTAPAPSGTPVQPAGPPPPRAGTGNAPTGLSLPRSGPLVGTVTGHPSVVNERREFFGQRVLVFASAAAMLMSLAFLLAAGPAALGPLLAPIVTVMLFVLVYQVLVRGSARSGAAALLQGTVRTASRVSRSMTAGTAAAVRRRRVYDLPVTRFRLTPVAGGGPVDCVMYGQPKGPDLRHGDVVSATGRRRRDGTYRVHRVAVLATPTGPVVGQVTARPAMRLRIAGIASWLSYGLAALIVLWVAAVLLGA